MNVNSHSSTDNTSNESHSVASLTGSLVGQLSRLASQEISLAKAEVKEVARKSARDSVGVIAGAALVHLGAVTLVALAALGLSYVMPLWASLLTLTVTLFALGALTIVVGLNKIESDTTLKHLPRSLNRNREFLKGQVA